MSDSKMPTRDIISVSDFIRGHLEHIKDEGSAIDIGKGFGLRDLWVTIDGVEYFVTVRLSAVQEARNSK